MAENDRIIHLELENCELIIAKKVAESQRQVCEQ